MKNNFPKMTKRRQICKSLLWITPAIQIISLPAHAATSCTQMDIAGNWSFSTNNLGEINVNLLANGEVEEGGVISGSWSYDGNLLTVTTSNYIYDGSLDNLGANKCNVFSGFVDEPNSGMPISPASGYKF